MGYLFLMFIHVLMSIRWLLTRHVLFAPSAFNTYSSSSFPGLVDLMWGIDRLSPSERLGRWQQVRRHLATVIYTVQSASSVLRPPHRFH